MQKIGLIVDEVIKLMSLILYAIPRTFVSSQSAITHPLSHLQDNSPSPTHTKAKIA